MNRQEIEETLLRHSDIANVQSKVAEQHTDILLQLTNAYFELLEKVGQQKHVISAQGALLDQCMERIMQLEGRSILANFNQRLEQLEANRGTYYAVNKQQLPKMLEQVTKRVDALESWLYTHDYEYFKQEEKKHGAFSAEMYAIEHPGEELPGNSSFEEYEVNHPDPSYVERENMYYEKM